jgi:hypothetical protein
MKLNSSRQAWHDAFHMPWDSASSHVEQLGRLGCSVQKTERAVTANHAAHQALAGYIQRAIDTLHTEVKAFGNWMYNPLATVDDQETAEEVVFLGACQQAGRMTASKRERAEYVAKGVLYRYRRMHQGGQSSCEDPLASPEGFRAALLDVYGINIASEAWARDWQPFVQLCFDVCNDVDKMALRPVAIVIGELTEEAAA